MSAVSLTTPKQLMVDLDVDPQGNFSTSLTHNLGGVIDMKLRGAIIESDTAANDAIYFNVYMDNVDFHTLNNTNQKSIIVPNDPRSGVAVGGKYRVYYEPAVPYTVFKMTNPTRGGISFSGEIFTTVGGVKSGVSSTNAVERIILFLEITSETSRQGRTGEV